LPPAQAAPVLRSLAQFFGVSMKDTDHSSRLSRIEAENVEFRNALNVVFGKIDTVFGKLDAIASAVHELRGSAGPSLRDVMTTITQGAILFGIITGGILYLARGGNTEAIHELDKRIVWLETVMAIAMQPSRRAAPGTAWVPEGIAGR
jgi:hypothetical protein